MAAAAFGRRDARSAEAEISIDQGDFGYSGKTWAAPGEVAKNQSIPLPEPVWRALVKLASQVIAASSRAVAAADH